MKYTKGKQTYTLHDCTMTKIRLTDGGDFTENIWAKHNAGESHSILQNTACAFTPFPSWGAVIPTLGSFNFLKMLESKILELHPEAYEYYLKEGVIDEHGNYQEGWDDKTKFDKTKTS